MGGGEEEEEGAGAGAADDVEGAGGGDEASSAHVFLAVGLRAFLLDGAQVGGRGEHLEKPLVQPQRQPPSLGGGGEKRLWGGVRMIVWE